MQIGFASSYLNSTHTERTKEKKKRREQRPALSTSSGIPPRSTLHKRKKYESLLLPSRGVIWRLTAVISHTATICERRLKSFGRWLLLACRVWDAETWYMFGGEGDTFEEVLIEIRLKNCYNSDFFFPSCEE